MSGKVLTHHFSFSGYFILCVRFSVATSEYVDDGIRVIRITNVQKGKVVDNDPKYINLSRTDEFDNYRIFAGDILISLTGNVGRVGVLKKKHKPALLNQRVGVIRVASERVYPTYLFQYLNSNYFENNAIKNSNGVAQLNLSSKWVEGFKIPTPPFNDQIRIATLLRRVEALINTRKDNLRLLDDFLKSTFLEMFGPTNSNFEKWPLTEIKDLEAEHKGAMRTGPFGSNLLHSEFTERGDVAVLGIDNAVKNHFSWGKKRFITSKKYETLGNYRLFPDDVIITIMGTVGRSAVIPKDIPLAINTKHLAAITFNKEKANPQFMSYSIHSSPYIISQFVSKNRGAIMNGLNLGLIKETKLRKPPIKLQNQFAMVIEKVEIIKSQYQQNLTELENLYGSLSQKAFKGELDLSRIPLPNAMEGAVIEPVVEVKAEIEQAEYSIPNPETRQTLLRKLFDAFTLEQKDKTFLLDDFWQYAETNSQQYMDEDSQALGLSDYEQAKQWLFGLIESGQVEQQFVDDSKQIKLKVKG